MYVYVYIYLVLFLIHDIVFNMRVRHLHLRSFCHPVRPGSAQKIFGRRLILFMTECLF